jgi:hypothetical protein
MVKQSQQPLPSVAGVSANPLESRGRHRVNNMNPEAHRAEGWGNDTTEAYTGKPTGHRAGRIRLKVDTAP